MKKKMKVKKLKLKLGRVVFNSLAMLFLIGVQWMFMTTMFGEEDVSAQVIDEYQEETTDKAKMSEKELQDFLDKVEAEEALANGETGYAKDSLTNFYEIQYQSFLANKTVEEEKTRVLTQEEINQRENERIVSLSASLNKYFEEKEATYVDSIGEVTSNFTYLGNSISSTSTTYDTLNSSDTVCLQLAISSMGSVLDNMGTLSGSQRTAIETMFPGAVLNYQQYGILPSVTLAQFCNESTWGASDLFTQYNNPFGVKAGEGWGGSKALLWTQEFVNGFYEDFQCYFRVYPTMEQGILNYGKFFHENPRYANAGVLTATTSAEQITCIANAGYATSPTYAQNVYSVVSQYKFEELDTLAKSIISNASKLTTVQR